MTSQEVNAAIRESLGLSAKSEPQPTFPQEGHVSEFPYWSFSKKRSAQFIVATRGRKVDCLASYTDQTCCSISSILRRCAGR
jgi:hypothetical protein